MINRVEKTLNDARQNHRVNENRSVSWQVDGGQHRGNGKVKNISSSGMLLETDANDELSENTLITVDADLGFNNFIPRVGRVVWHKKKRFPPKSHVCGVRFVEPTDFVQTRLNQRVTKQIESTSNNKKIGTIVNNLALIALVAITSFVFYLGTQVYESVTQSNDQLMQVSSDQAALTRTYALQVKELQVELNDLRAQYDQSQSALSGVTQELEEARTIIAQTETLLEEARARNQQLQGDFNNTSRINEEEFNLTKKEFENAISLLEEQNAKLVADLSLIQSEFDYYKGNVRNIDDGKSLLKTYKLNAKKIKKRIKNFKKQAAEIRKAAQRERDRLKLSLGNNGFFVKDGSSVEVDLIKYNAVDSSSTLVQESTVPSTGLKVDVTIVE